MSDERFAFVRRLFEQAAELPPRQRADFLARECAGNPALLAEVQALLNADEAENSAVDLTFSQLTSLLSRRLEPEPLPFWTCGDYRLVRRLGGGGMGEVFLAERIDNGNRVAIKVLKRDSASVPDIVNRFEREKELLGRLQHPNVARFYHSGVESGRLWFAMDYIEGRPIDAYCRANNLPLCARLELMGKLSAAVAHAHAKLIVHCDLTPNNVLVTSDGEPHLVDFGIARMLSESPEAQRLTTGSRPYSVDYASPEQIRNKPLDTRTDSWSLGAILYTLLADGPPFVAAGILSDRVIEDKILNDEPLPPSTAARAHGVPSSFASHSDWKELDILCLWALRKEPENRCRVDQLGDDIARFLRTEPLQARPAGWRYFTGKFLRRNKTWVIAATTVCMVIAGFAVFSSLRIARERDKALAEAARTRRIQRFMLSMFGGGDKEAAPSNELRVVSLLDRGAREAATLNSDPETQAELYQTLGTMYQLLGKYPKADQLLQSALDRLKATVGPGDPRLADTLEQLGLLRGDQARFKEAQKLAREALNLVSPHRPAEDPAVVKAEWTLGQVLDESGAYGEAIAVLNPIVRRKASGEQEAITLADSLGALGYAHLNAGRYDIAESLYRRELAVDRELFGQGHPRVAFDLSNFGTDQTFTGQLLSAENSYRQALEIMSGWYGPDHPETAAIASFLAQILSSEGKYAEAGILLERVLPIEEQARGKDHPQVAFVLNAMGKIAVNRGDFVAAEADYRRSLSIMRASYGDGDYQTAVLTGGLGQVFVKEGRYAQAEPLLRNAISVLSARPSSANVSLEVFEIVLGRALLRQKRFSEAERYLTAGYAVFSKQPARGPKSLRDCREDLAELYSETHRPGKAAEFRAKLATGPKSRQ